MRVIYQCALAGLALSWWAAAPLAAQGHAPRYTFESRADFILLDVGVENGHGAPVGGLTRSQFRVFDNGRAEPLSYFASNDLPVTVGLVVDSSGSMGPKRAEVNAAALSFIRDSNPLDEIFVVNFNDRVYFGLPPGTAFSDKVPQLVEALGNTPNQGRTTLYDAISAALEHLDLGKRDKKTLVVISDGGDNASRSTLAQVLAQIEASRATVYTIGLFDADDPDSNPKVLKRLAAVSGGEAYFPRTLEEVPELCRRIAVEIRRRYSLGFAPVRAGTAASRHVLKVEAWASDGRKLKVHARQSYWLPALPAEAIVPSGAKP